MLNELLAVERALSAHGVTFAARHPDIKDAAKGSFLCARLDQDGGVHRLEILEAKGRGSLWSLRDGQHNGFPVLKTDRGLLALDADTLTAHEERWKAAPDIAAKRAELLHLVSSSSCSYPQNIWPKSGHRDRIAERLGQLGALKDDPDTAAVPAIFERFLKAVSLPIPLLPEVLNKLEQSLLDGPESWIEPAKAALTAPAILVFEVANDPAFSRLASDARQIPAISRVLSASALSAGDSSEKQCALTGETTTLLEDNFPQPNLPGLGQTYLYARNRDIAAMARYGHSGTSSMPIGAELAARLQGVLLALTAEDRRNKTWKLIPAEAGDKPDLLIASLASAPDVPLAMQLESGDAPTEWNDVEDVTTPTLSTVLGKAVSENPHGEVRLLLLRAVDPANRKAVLDRRTTVQQLHASALHWERAMRNTPLAIRYHVAGKDKTVFLRSPPIEAPLSLISLSRRFYTHSGARALDITGLTASECLALLLQEGNYIARARRVLALLLQRQQSLLIALGLASRRVSHGLREFDKTTDLRKAGLRSIAWLGALLYMLGRKREDYMQDAAYKLGQLLAGADEVHAGYCAHVRGGQTPPTLIGNSVFAIAGRNPVKALDVFQQRWKPYGAWATAQAGGALKKASELDSKGDKTNKDLAGRIRLGVGSARRVRALVPELRSVLEEQANARFRAELLLGYLAGPERAKNLSKVSASTEGDNDSSDENQGEEQ